MSFLFTSVVKTIEVGPPVPGIRDEILLPQAKLCSPELDSPSCQFKSPFSQKLQRLQEKLIVTPLYFARSTCSLYDCLSTRLKNCTLTEMLYLKLCVCRTRRLENKMYFVEY